MLVNGQPLGRGTGKNKKEAEQLAAQQAIEYLNIN
ncbi:putative dsRNA-binding protein [uncultured Methanobrevibacter sp.]|nr:putative dsRNA-binding protein [uncultured Methanobrevibacter sp.]